MQAVRLQNYMTFFTNHSVCPLSFSYYRHTHSLTFCFNVLLVILISGSLDVVSPMSPYLFLPPTSPSTSPHTHYPTLPSCTKIIPVQMSWLVVQEPILLVVNECSRRWFLFLFFQNLYFFHPVLCLLLVLCKYQLNYLLTSYSIKCILSKGTSKIGGGLFQDLIQVLWITVLVVLEISLHSIIRVQIFFKICLRLTVHYFTDIFSISSCHPSDNLCFLSPNKFKI